ncbi:MAG: transcription-repair coupling factor [Gemmatimonadales bacterium]|nr:MAG: transcription-repair coupling factor [Gemmatimonadales bacterium]
MTSRIHPVLEGIRSTPAFRAVSDSLPMEGRHAAAGGLLGSASGALVAGLHLDHPRRNLVVVARDPDGAARMEADLLSLLGDGAVHLYPQGEARFYGTEDDPRIGGLRVEAVEALLAGESRILVTTPRALQERVDMPDRLATLRLELEVGDEVGLSLLLEELEVMGFQRTPLVEEVGQLAVRGGIVDVFSLGHPDPLRIEFWGDEISSIRLFDVSNQRSRQELTTVQILPASFRSAAEAAGGSAEGAVGAAPSADGAMAGADGSGTGAGSLRSLLEILPDESLLVGLEQGHWEEIFQTYWTEARRIRADREEGGETLPPPDRILTPPDEAARRLRRLPVLRLTSEPGTEPSFSASTPPDIERKMDRLEAFLREGEARGARTVILCDNHGQVERLEEILQQRGATFSGVHLGVGSLEAGFVLPDAVPVLRVLTDHEIFKRSRRVRSGRSFRGAVALESMAQLSPGDYLVHMDHGIGRFKGLEQIEVGGEALEVLAVEYAGGEILRVPVYRLDLLERWIGGEEGGEPPSVHRIGGKRWKTLKRKTEEAVERMTQELVELYAERELGEGFAFSADTHWQREMESSFLYEDTPDQARVTKEVKRDMEKSQPMDRLICGDVGFGKTEVAVRAAFKAVQDGKQVAVLAPTTILVEQHRRTFEERLADFPVKVAGLSRFRSRKEQEEMILGIERGEVDIVVGTHRLLSKDIRFRELGLLIVDEEQRFGVKHKERLKKMRASVDVLTLTATPIPRTLQLSLGGLRDLSLIRTPPRDRLAVSTQAIPWSDAILSEVMARELDRGGQVYFLHNRVETIHTTAERVRRITPPGTRIEVAHGQMKPGPLEDVMAAFIEGKIDVLVCSSIIENGLDVPNANTLVVDRADHFGLAQLYQIRGRVGRSDRRAYCYLVVPESMTEDARTRIRVLERHTELGSGYEVALRDLEIRGAGNLLGANQSGFAHAVGMDTYLRLLEDAVRRLRRGAGQAEEFPEPDVSLAGSAFIPDEYVSDSSQKLHLYRRLSRLESRPEVEALRDEMVDRYGPMPESVERLLDAHILRLLGRKLGLERIFVRDRSGRLTFRAAANPRLTVLQAPFRDRQVEVGVRRMMPLSLSLTRVGPEPLTRTLIRSLDLLVSEEAQAA